MKLTIDASVWVSAFVAGDVNHAQSDQLLESCLASRTKVIVPEMVLLEVAAGVARILQNDGQGQIAAKKVERFPALKLLPLRTAFLNKSIILATRHFLRAADALYVATARDSKTTLVTLDDEMLQRRSRRGHRGYAGKVAGNFDGQSLTRATHRLASGYDADP